MKTSTAGLDLIKHFEQLVLTAYLCPANVWTIGYGHTGTDVHKGMVITEQRANQLLQQDVERFENRVLESVHVPLNQNQFDALVSLCFNIGESAFANSTLVRRINEQAQPEEIRAQFLRWVNAKGKRLIGLVYRREKEFKLFNTKP